MRPAARLGRLAAAGVLLLGAAFIPTITPAAASTQPSTLPENSVTATVLSMAPTTPAYTNEDRPLTVRLSLRNTTAATLYDVGIEVVREAPIGRLSVLEGLFAHPRVLDRTVILSPLRLDAPIAPHATATVTYHTATGKLDTTNNICLCGTGIYPIDFTVRAAAAEHGWRTQVGFAQTYLPSFQHQAQPVQVSWLWPLIDRPHRTTSTDVFTDDDLAKSVAKGGRLDRALQVVEDVEPKVRLTLLIDPELLAELAVMSAHYEVRTPDGKLTTGTGGAAARAWLARLQAVLPESDVSLTAPSDPDVDALARNGLPWSAQASASVRKILGGVASHDIAWPAGGVITPAALRAVVAQGSSAVVLDDAAFAGSARQSTPPDAIATLPVSGARAVVTDTQVEKLVSAVLSRDQAGAGKLPQLVTDLAIRAVQDPQRSHYVAITPDRYVDADPGVAASAIRDTSTPPWAQSRTIRQAVHSITPADAGQPVAPTGDAAGEIPQQIIDQVVTTRSFAAALRSALRPADAATLLGGLPAAMQRCESSAWRVDPAGGEGCAADLGDATSHWGSAVTIAQPSNGSYTMASRNAPLFVTLVNRLPVPVTVQVSLSTVNGVVGFHTDAIAPQTIPAKQKLPLRIKAHVQRTGHFQVDADLATPDGAPLGSTVRLSISSTALGAVGVIITSVAGGVLFLALLVRVIRRARTRPAAGTGTS